MFLRQKSRGWTKAAIIMALLFGNFQKALCDPAYDDYVRGQRCMQTGQWQQAIGILTRAINAEPKYLNAYIARGFAYSRLEKLDLALQNYEKVLALAPANSVALADKGFCLYKFGKLKEALACLNRALELDPERADFLVNRGEVFLKMRERDKAIKDCTASINLDDSDADCYITRADAFMQQKNYNQAIKDYSKAISLNPDPVHMFHREGESYYKRGHAYMLVGRELQAERDFDTSRELGYKPETEDGRKAPVKAETDEQDSHK